MLLYVTAFFKFDGRIITEQPLQVDPKPGVMVKGKPGRKYPDTIVKAIKVWLQLMQEHGIIQPSLSKTSSPLLVVKQDGKYRFTCDNTEINKSIPQKNFFLFFLYIYSSSKQAGDGTEREITHERESNFKKGNVMDDW